MTSKLSPEKELEVLKGELEKLNSQRNNIWSRISDLEDILQEPALRKKYVGKYFKYKNTYGTGKTWGLYFHVLGVKGTNLIVNSFQSMPHGENEFKINDSIGDSLLMLRIRKGAYETALNTFMKKAKQLK